MGIKKKPHLNPAEAGDLTTCNIRLTKEEMHVYRTVAWEYGTSIAAIFRAAMRAEIQRMTQQPPATQEESEQSEAAFKLGLAKMLGNTQPPAATPAAAPTTPPGYAPAPWEAAPAAAPQVQQPEAPKEVPF